MQQTNNKKKMQKRERKKTKMRNDLEREASERDRETRQR